MKKLISTLLIMFVMTAFTSVTYADEPMYWKGDKRFPRIYDQRMNTFYLDKTSMVVKEINSPYYVIAANVFVAADNPIWSNPSDKILRVWTFEFRYDTDKTEMYVKSNDKWTYLDPMRPYMSDSRELFMATHAGEALWYIFKNKKFYGSRMWKNKQTGELEETTIQVNYRIL